MDHHSALLAARSLSGARRSGQRLPGLPEDCTPGSLAEAYQIQDVVVACYGERVAAWKVGATHPNAQANLGVPGPVAARLFEPFIHAGDRTLPDTFLVRGLEAEYAFLLGADLPPRAGGYRRAEIEAAVASVHPAIEVVDTRFVEPPRGALAVADNVNDGAWIYGPGVSDWRQLDLIGAEVTMSVNGEVVARGSGADVLGDPLDSLSWLVNEHAGAREGLRAGQFVTAGSCTGLYRAPPGCTARASFAGLGCLELHFRA